jgi:hypothetical protein
MATTNILGLFMSPEQYQAQQMAQQQAGEQQRAINFAGLTPLQQANYGVFMGAQQLGRGITGLLGVQDPQLQRIRQRQEIMQSINPADLESLMGGIQRASQMGDQELALTLTDFMNEQGSKMALARQRQAQADRERAQALPAGIQEAARIREITLLQANLDPESIEWKSLEDEKIRLQKTGRAKSDTEAYKNAFQLTVAQNPTLDTESQEFQGFLATNLQSLLLKDKPESKTEAQRNAYDITLARYPNLSTDSPEFKTEYGKILDSLVSKKDGEKRSPEAQLAIDAGYIPGSPAYADVMDKMIAGKLPGGRQIEKLVINSEIVRLKELQAGLEKDSPEYKSYQEQIEFLGGGAGKNKVSAFGQLLIDKGIDPGSSEWNSKMDAYIAKELAGKEERDQIVTIGETVAGNKEGLPAGLKVYSNKTNKTQYVLRDGKEVSYYGSVEPPGKTTVEVKNIMPGQGKDGLTGIGKFRNEVGESIKPFRTTVNAADAALQNINDSIKSNNFTSFNAARVQLARALGDSTLSRRDIEQAGGDPSLIGGFFDATSTLFTGTPTVDTQRKIKATLQAIRSVARKKAQDELAVQRQLGLRAGYSDQDINMAFNFPEITGAGGGGAKPPPKKAVPYNALPK